MNVTQTVTQQECVEEKKKEIFFLFDVDGTLSPSREKAPRRIIDMLVKLRAKVTVAFVGGSDLKKQLEQLGSNALSMFDYSFPENGVQFYKGEELVSSASILEYIGERKYVEIANKLLCELSKIDCPAKRGNFIELRSSVLNISPVGRSCSADERKAFFKYDKEHRLREKLCERIREPLKEHGLVCSIGGQISIDIFPEGWDKTYCLRHIDEEAIIIFFGDMTMKGGNDYEIANHERVKGVTVQGPDDTIAKVNEELVNLGMDPL